ncbi:NB-ARC domain-containing protein [Microseira wollei]|uniref:WD-40 repeat protein n=1 Tax=Microseira wollei NIES-4236 TaxID=2530354 RepID=A0AAV3X621_9CYAN|nr:NB-ARC domain-containing protein [Microseira wollei]GET35530.1 WD-40 repeat protein [Microseira wollei NIES-4236]
MPRSLKVRTEYIGKVKLAVRRNGFPSQRELAEDLRLALCTVSNFLTGKPVDRAIFEEICQKLSLNWKEIADVGIDTSLSELDSKTNGSKISEALPLRSCSQAEPGNEVWKAEPGNEVSHLEILRSRKDLGEAPDVSLFYGRQQEIATLEQWILHDRCRLVAILGVGGIGKTALSAKFVSEIADNFEYVVWRSLRNSPPLEEILTELIQFFTPPQHVNLPATEYSIVSRFLDYLRQHRCLIVLDNCESILKESTCVGEYKSGYEGYGYLLKCIGETQHQSCVVLTSREKPSELVQMEGERLSVRSLRLNGLSELEGYKILETKGYSGSVAELKPLVERYSGNPLALKVIATTITELFDNNIAEFLNQETIIFGEIWKLISEQFDRLSPVETQVMYWLAIEREWTSFQDIRENIFPSVARRELLEAIASLQRRSLIEKQSSSFTQQPVIMEYITNRLIEQVQAEIKTEEISLLHKFALIKTQSKEFGIEAQLRLIVNPIIEGLRSDFRTEANIRKRLDNLLHKVRSEDELRLGYAAGNLINLYRYLGLDIARYDFSKLTIRQAFLQDMNLHEVNFSNSEFIHSLFAQTFGGVLAVRFSPDGQTLATSSTNCEIQLWEVANKQQILTLQGHNNWVRCIAFNPDGKLLVSASDDGTLRVWDLSKGVCKNVLRGHSGNVYGSAFSPDGQLIASTSHDGTIRLWSVENGNCLRILSGHFSAVIHSSFSPCGKLLATGSFDHTIRIWDVYSGTCLHTLTEHKNWVTGLSFSPDGKWLASPSCDRTIRIWRVADWQCIRVLEGHNGWIWGVDWNPDSQLIASCSVDCTVKIWEIMTGECLRTLAGHGIQIWRVAFSPDGRTIATGAEDQTIGLWDVESGRRITTMTGYSNWVRSAIFSPNGAAIATGHKDKTLRIWDSNSYQCLQQLLAHAGGISSIAFHPHSSLLASGGHDSIVKVWNWRIGECLAVLKGHSDEVWGLAFSPIPPTPRRSQAEPWEPGGGYDPKFPPLQGGLGGILASSSFDQTIRLWDIENKTCLKVLLGHRDRIPTLAFHPKVNILASGSDDCTIKLWNITEGNCCNTLTGHNARVGTVAFNADGNLLLSASLDGTLKIWHVGTGECLQTLQGHANWVMSAAFFPDGRTVASAGCDRTIKIWDSHTGQCLHTLTGHTNWIWTVAISPDGQKLISASEDESVRIWNLETGSCITTLKPKRPYEGMQITGVTGLTLAQEAMLKELGAI